MIRATFEPTANGVTVYRWDVLNANQRSYWTHDGKRKTVNNGEAAPWWLVLDKDEAKELAVALADHIDKDQRGDPEDYGYIKGLYEAQRDHLQDMRKLVILDHPEMEPRE